MSGPWEDFATKSAEGSAAPWDDFKKPGQETLPAVDFSRPVEEVRAEIGKVQDPKVRQRLLDKWADSYVAKEKAGDPKSDPLGLASAFDKILATPVRNVARGTIVGSWADEANALTAAAAHKLSGGNVGAPYDEALAYQRAVDRYNDKASPVLSTVTQIAGGLASAAPVANAVIKGAQTMLGKMMRGAGVGAVHGGVAGAGNDESGDRLSGARTGAAIGSAIGTVIPPVAYGAAWGIDKAANVIRPTATRLTEGADAAAEAILGQRMRAAGAEPQKVAKELLAGQAATRLGPNSYAELPETIADTSNSMQRLTGAVYRAGGEAGDNIKGTLQSRQRGPANPYAPKPGEQAGQHERIMDAVDRSMGISTSKGAYRTEQAVIKDMRDKATTKYALAEKSQDPFDLQPAFDAMALKIQQYPRPMAAQLSKALGLFVNPTNAGANAAIVRIQKGMELLDKATSEPAQKQAQALIQNGYDTLAKIRTKSNAPFAVDNIRRFDLGKRALDDMIDGAEGNMKRELVEFKNNLLDLVHLPKADGTISNPIYKVARDSYAEGKRGQEAIELGRKALTMDKDAFNDQYRALDAAQKKMARIGIRDAIRSALSQTKPGNDTTLLFQQKRVVDLLSEVIPGRQRPEQFGAYLSREERMAQTNKMAFGNSMTPERLNDDAQLASSIMSEMFNRFKSAPSLYGAVVESVGYGMQRLFGYRQDVANALAKRLMESDPARQAQILQAVEKRMGPDKFSEFVDTLNRSLFTLERAMAVQSSQPSAALQR
jgi:hypothetical protein